MRNTTLNSPKGVHIVWICLGSIIWMIVTTVITLIPQVSAWIATPVVLVGILGVPGVLLAINLRISTDNMINFVLYAIGLGLSFLIIGGLAMNYVMPYVGVYQPLAKLPLLYFFDSSVLVLAGCAFVFNRKFIVPFQIRFPNKVSVFFGSVPILFILLSVCGAQILNNSGSGLLTLLMLFGIALYIIALVFWGRSVQGWVYMVALYLITLSLLLMYSLRSTHIIGWDINLEYRVFQTTLRHLVWSMSYYPTLDYNACISITILPTIFQVLTHIPTEYVYKVIYQILFAVVPVMVYAIARRYMTDLLAFIAAFFLMSQTWFFEQMPALIRQETAFIFFVVALLTLLDRQLALRTRYILFYLFTIGLILSHYSTAYVWITMISGVTVLSYGMRALVPSLRERPVFINVAMLIIPVVLLCVWEIPVTGSAGELIKFVAIGRSHTSVTSATSTKFQTVASTTMHTTASSTSLVQKQATKVFVPDVLTKIIFTNGVVYTKERLMLAEREAINTYNGKSSFIAYPDAADSGYVPHVIDGVTRIEPKVPHIVSIFFMFLARADKLLLVGVFPLVGIYVGWYRRNDEVYDLALLCAVAYILIISMVFIPRAQVYYNLTRLYIQMCMILSPLAVIGGLALLKYVTRRHTVVFAIMMGLFFSASTGALDHIVGGFARITLDQPPSTLDIFYINDAEVASTQWLTKHRDQSDPVQTDIIALLRLQAYGSLNPHNLAIFPQTIEQGSYVYLIKKNIINGETYYLYKNELLTYNYPLAFVDNHKDLIYNNGDSRVYR